MKKQNRLFGLALAFSLILGTAGCQKAEEPKKEDKIVETDKTKTSKKSEENTSDKKDAKSSIKEDETKSDSSKTNTASSSTNKTNNSSSSSTASSNTNKSNSGTSTTKPSTSQNTAKSSGNTKSNTATNTNKNTNTNNNSGSGSTKTNTSQNNTKTETKPSEPSKPAHTHSWTNVTKTVHHAEQGHNEQVLVQDAWDEPTYSTVERSVCNQCGADITGFAVAHNEAHMDAFESGGYHSEWVQQQTGTVHHDAVYQTTYVVDSPAYDETVVTGQQCSCGATR